MSMLPQYKFDPITQKYTLLNPPEKKAEQQVDVPLFMDSGGGDPSLADPSGFGSLTGPQQAAYYAENPTMSSITQGLQALMGATMAGRALMTLQDMVDPGVPGGKTSFTTQQHSIAQGINPDLASPVAPPGPMTVTPIAPDPAFSNLAAMNAAVTQSIADANQAQAQSQAAAEAVEAASALSMSPGVADAPAAAAAPAADAGGVSSDSGGGGFGGYGGGFGQSGGGGSEFGGDVGTSSDPGSMGIGGGFVKGGPISMKRYADGGMTMSPQNYGRMGDSMLVHMNPREVAGLQSLARSQGTSLTVNPQTGYPEAFNLKAFLPTLIGLGLTAATGGAAAAPLISGLSNAATIGLGTGALTGVATGSLKKGLQAGLGAYGGAGIGEGLIGTAGAATPVPSSVPGVTSTYSGATPGVVSPQFSTGTGGFGGSVIDRSNFANPATVAMPGTAAAGTAPGFGSYGNISPSSVASPQISPSSFTPDTALSGVSPTPDKFIGNLSGKDLFKYGTAVAASIPPTEYEPPLSQSTAMLRPYDYSFNPITGAYDPRPGDSSEVLYGASTFTPREVVPARAGGMMSSGLAAFKEGGRPKSRRLMDEKGLGGIPYYDFMGERGSNLDSVEKNFAQGGTPRFLSGGGDGMSDDIPAVIGNKQPARLADGEFVIPADVVSHIGNGSSKAGAKKLYKMMADIREERTGKTKQAPAIKPERYMPA